MTFRPMSCMRFTEWVNENEEEPTVHAEEDGAFAAHYVACAVCRERHGRRELFLQKVIAAVQDADPEGSKALMRWDQTLEAFCALAAVAPKLPAPTRRSRRTPVRKTPKSAG